MKKFKSVDELVNQLKPSNPVYCIRKHTLEKASKFFQKNFKGKILYAVKTNQNEFVLKHLFNQLVFKVGCMFCKIVRFKIQHSLSLIHI